MTELTTERLTLRQWRFEDFEPLAAFLGDAELSRYRTGPIDRLAAWQFFCGQLGQWPLRGYGVFAVEPRGSSAVIGYSGLWHPVIFDEPELTWSLFAGHHGKGYATEMAARVQRWAAESLDLPPLMSLVHPDNTPSRKVAERLGARVEKETEFRGQPRLVYRHRDLKHETTQNSLQTQE